MEESNRLKKIREINNCPINNLAIFLNIPISDYIIWEDNYYYHDVLKLEKFCTLFNCPTDYILEKEKFYKKPNIDYQNNDLYMIYKMNQIMNHIKLLRELKE